MDDKPTVLLVEDDNVAAKTYQIFLKKESIDLIHVSTGTAALEYLQRIVPWAIVLDLMLPDMNGMSILKALRQQQLKCPIIIISAQTSADIIVEAMRNGAFDYLEKPFNANRLLFTLHNALRQHDLYETIGSFQKIHRSHYYGLIGVSKPMRTIYHMIDTVATSKAAVFITGESGTGKELCAEAIHKQSKRKDKPFIALNCAAIPKDLIESELFGHVKGAFTGAVSHRDGAVLKANGGTLFLDEIGDMDIKLQSTLLRFVQTGRFRKVGSDKEEQVDVRFVCATNRDVLSEIEAGHFREDLYYRLNVIDLKLPALRIREKDVLLLAQTFLSQYAQQEQKSFEGFTKEVEQILLDYDWPGNVRQLQNVIRNIVVLNNAQKVTPDMLPAPLNEAKTKEEGKRREKNEPTPQSASNASLENGTVALSPDVIRPLWQVEKETIEQALELTNGNVLEAAKRLKISTPTIYRKLNSWNKQVKRSLNKTEE